MALNDEAQNITYLNPAFIKTFGYTPDDIPTLPDWWPKAYPDVEYRNWVKETWQTEFERAKRSGQPFQPMELRIRCKDGSTRFVHASASALADHYQGEHLIQLYDITERKKADEELRASRQRLEILSRQLITTQEAERRHLSRELHDEIGQVLTAVKMNLRRTQMIANDNLKTRFQDNIDLIDQAIHQVRNLSLNLRPPQLDELGLIAAFHWLVQHQADLGRFHGDLHVELGDAQLSPDLEIIVFRVAQEALTNAVRHGHPKQVRVTLRANDDRLILSIDDDGAGFDVMDRSLMALKGKSVGLISMKERASLAGGHLQIDSIPGRGTRIEAWFPLSES